MSDETYRPRRAWQPEDDPQEPVAPDNLPEEGATGPRRGAPVPEESRTEPGLGDDPAEQPEAEPPHPGVEAPDPGVEALQSEEAPPDAGAVQPRNPFARPGSEQAAAPLGPETDPVPFIPAPVFPRSAGEYADSPSPAPRRSALSSSTPVEADEKPLAAEAQPSWAAAHRATLVRWALIGLVGAVIVGLIAFFVARGMGTAEPGGEQSASTSASPSGSPTPAPEPAAETDLVSEADLTPIAPAGEWSVIDTTVTAAEHTMRPLCLSTVQQAQNPTHSFQRTLGTTGEDKLAALHRVEAFASAAAAEAVMAERIAALSICTEVPARMERATTISGLAEQTFQVTILQQETPAKYHTILLTRDGAAVQLLDVARDEQATDPLALATSLVRPQTRIAEVQGAAGPSTPEAVNTVVPPAEPVGWLVPIDLPRLNSGAGRWTMTAPQPIDTRGMGCENIELATEPGPTERAKVAYSLTQDPAVPERFGVDELLFTFPTPAEAAAFVTKLGSNMLSCKDRVNTAEVAELPGASPRDAAGNMLSARVFTTSQAISDTQRVYYQTVVGVAGNKVAYALVSVTPEAQFTAEELSDLAARIMIRASQLP